jgi:hypothetical protein
MGAALPAHSAEDRIAKGVMMLLALGGPPVGAGFVLWSVWRNRALDKLLRTPNGLAKVEVIEVRHRGRLRSYGLRFHPVEGRRVHGIAVPRRDLLEQLLQALRERFPAASLPNPPR